jgi:gliding motility-associated-like protein
MPNVITPKASMNKKLLEGYDIQVFNRLGSELYHGTDGWDGTYKGAYVAAGTYFYVLRYKQGDKDMTLKHSVFVKY